MFSCTDSKPTLKILIKELKCKAAEWEDIGVQLQLGDGDLEQIKLDNNGCCKRCLRDMFRKWLAQVSNKCSWLTIIHAIHDLGDERLAATLSERYIR